MSAGGFGGGGSGDACACAGPCVHKTDGGDRTPRFQDGSVPGRVLLRTLAQHAPESEATHAAAVHPRRNQVQAEGTPLPVLRTGFG